jgi:hypothetical protein
MNSLTRAIANAHRINPPSPARLEEIKAQILADLKPVIRQYSSTSNSVKVKHIREKVSLRTQRLCPRYRPVRLQLSTQQICRRISAISRSRVSWDIKSERSRCQLREKKSAIDWDRRITSYAARRS